MTDCELFTWAIDGYVIGNHAQRDRLILKRRLLDGLTYYELLREFSVYPNCPVTSERRIRRIVHKWADVIYQRVKEKP